MNKVDLLIKNGKVYTPARHNGLLGCWVGRELQLLRSLS